VIDWRAPQLLTCRDESTQKRKNWKRQELDTVRAWENKEEIGAVNYILIGNIG
jgi:hypothetical protein